VRAIGFWHRLDVWAGRAAPVTLTVLLVLLGAVPLPLPFWQPIGPGYALISVYYWAVHRPTALPAPLVFLIGVLADFFGLAPLGVGTLVLLICYSGTVSQRRHLVGQHFLVVWWGFMMVSAAGFFIAWAAASVLAVRFVDARPAFFSYLVTLGAYPLVALLLARAQRSFAATA
jgi:rod shape-determining protein MreD